MVAVIEDLVREERDMCDLMMSPPLGSTWLHLAPPFCMSGAIMYFIHLHTLAIACLLLEPGSCSHDQSCVEESHRQMAKVYEALGFSTTLVGRDDLGCPTLIQTFLPLQHVLQILP